MQSYGQQLPSHQNLQADAKQPHSLDLEAIKVSFPNTQANIKAKIADIDKRLVHCGFIFFLIYLGVCFLAGALYFFASFVHFKDYQEDQRRSIWCFNLFVLWFICQYAVEGFAIIKSNFIGAVVAVVLFVINSLLLIAAVVIFGITYNYTAHYQLPGADEEISKIVTRIMRDALISSVVVLAVQVLINLPVSIKLLIMLKERKALVAQLAIQ